MTDDDELRSVRIEVEDDAGSLPDAPGVAQSSSGSHKWIAGLVMLAVGVIGAFLLLRPAADEAADGTARLAPTTTIAPPAETTTTESPPETEPPQAVLAAVEVISASLTELEQRPVDIVQTSDGYLALLPSESVERPALLRSDDGLAWTQLETSVSNPRGVALEFLTPTELSTSSGQLSLLARPLGETDISPEILVSTSGSEWEVLDSSAIQAQGQEPLTLTDDSLITIETVGGPLDDVFEAHTDLVVDEAGICGVAGQSEFTELQVLGCDSSFVVLDESNIVSEFEATTVLRCFASLSRQSRGVLATFRGLDVTGETISQFGFEEQAFFFNFGFGLTTLASGSLAVYDVGLTGNRSCDEILGTDARAPSIMILEPSNERVFQLPFGALFVDILGESRALTSNFSVETEGETRVVAEGDPYLLVSLDWNLWVLNTTSGEWTQLTNTGLEGTNLRPVFTSDSGNRAYVLNSGLLTVIELDESTTRVFEGTRRSAPIETVGPSSVSELAREDVVFASDDAIFVDGLNGLWLLEPSAQQTEPEAPEIVLADQVTDDLTR